MPCSNSAATRHTSNPLLPRGLVVGFGTAVEAESEILTVGAVEVWIKGRGIQALAWAQTYLRGRPGTVAVAEDLRCFGATRKEIFATVKALMAKGVSVVDVRDLAASAFDLVERAITALQSSAALGCRKTAQRRGKRGGDAKGAAAAQARSLIVRDDILHKIVNHPKLTWADIMDILCGAFSKSTLIRHCREAA